MSEDADLLVSSNWRRHIPEIILEGFKHGGINVHRSLLPQYGGVAPINWAIACGETSSGVTIHLISGEFDQGDIILQREYSIGPDETATEIFHKTTPLVQQMVSKVLSQIEEGTTVPVKQNPKQGSFFHKRLERDLQIDWTKPNTEVYNLIRAQSDPFANAFSYLNGNRVNIKSASLPKKCFRGTPGRLFMRSTDPDGVVVVCGMGERMNQGLILHLVQEEGGLTTNANKLFRTMGQYFANS